MPSMANNNAIHNEIDDNCPPGMKFDKDADKCVSTEKFKAEEGNAGDTNPKGAGTNVDADDTQNPGETHDCPAGTSWNGSECAPTGDAAGQPGNAGTGSATVPGKESNEAFYKMIERLMASHTMYNEKLMDSFKEYNTKSLQELLAGQGQPSLRAESAAFGVKSESFKGSSMVSDSGYKSAYESTVADPAHWFEAIKNHVSGTGDFISWYVNPEAFFRTLKQSWMNYGQTSASKPITKEEAFTISAGDMPQIFSKQVYLIPGGRMRVPIRQFLDTQIIEDSDRFNWYKVNGFAFDDTTAEGTEPTNEAQTVTKVTGLPTGTRAVQTVNYADIENAPFDLIEAFNRAAALGSLDAEAKEVLDTTYDAITPTNWVNGTTGAAITTDDAAAVLTMKQEGLYHGEKLIMNQGGDISPGNMVFFAHPLAVTELVLDTAADFFTGQNALHATALGVLENRLGVDIVPTNKVNASTLTTTNAYRNVLAMKGSLGLAVAADLQIEAQRRPELSAVKVGARHRIDGAVIDETMTCRISSEQ